MVFHHSDPTSFNASGESEVLLHAGTAMPNKNAMLDTACACCRAWEKSVFQYATSAALSIASGRRNWLE